MRKLLTLMVLLSAFGGGAQSEELPTATLYKNPACACCDGYADYLRDNGFEVTVQPSHDLALLRREHGVPDALAGCHMTLVDGYVVEGHVPVGALLRMLAEKPPINGISLPGMPAGSPGMFGEKTEPFTIYEIGAEPKVYAVD